MRIVKSLIDLPSLQTINLSHRSLCGKEGVPSCSLIMRSTNGIVRNECNRFAKFDIDIQSRRRQFPICVFRNIREYIREMNC